MVDGDVASAADVGQCVLDLLYAGEASLRAYASAAARLDETVTTVELSRATGREQ